MKLLQKHSDGTLTVVNHPAGVNLRGVKDAFDVAQHAGDGEYIADMQDGSFLPFLIKDGQPPQGVDLGDIQYGQPHHQTAEGEKFTRGDSNSFPSMVGANEMVGREPEHGQAFDEYIPASERG